MKKLMTLSVAVASLAALSACGSVGDGYVDTQPPYNEERTAATAPTPMPTQQVVVQETQPVMEAPAPAPAPAPMQTAEPVFEHHVTK
ncbi:MAG: hypothetical protein AB7E85_03075 [Pseudobdellovibrionaceae bacterium]